MKSPREIVDGCNRLARRFYELQWCVVDVGYRFDRATHPAERGCWNLACIAFAELTDTDPEDALSELEESR